MSLDQTDATFVDESAPKPVTVAVAPLNLHLKDVTSNFTKPFGVDIDGTLNRKGTFKVTGTAAIAPLKADLRVGTKRLDLTFADPYIEQQTQRDYHERESDDRRRGRDSSSSARIFSSATRATRRSAACGCSTS